MKRSLLLPLIVTALFAAAAPLLHAGEAEDKAELNKLEGALSQLLAANDAAGLEARLAPDWKLVGEEGKVSTRPS